MRASKDEDLFFGALFLDFFAVFFLLGTSLLVAAFFAATFAVLRAFGRFLTAARWAAARAALAQPVNSSGSSKSRAGNCQYEWIVTGPKSENRSIRKSRSMRFRLNDEAAAARSPDAAQRAAVAAWCAADPGPISLGDVVVGPGSAEQREERCTASGTRYYTFAAVSCTDSPQPQAPVWFGLLKMNCADILSVLYSISVPSSNNTALGSTR